MKKTVSYILLIIWMIVIFYFSNQPGNISGDISGGIIYKTLEFIYNLFSVDTSNLEQLVEILHNPLRESMHMFEYFILAILIINVLKQYNIKNKIIISIMLCFTYAATDEIHQLFIPNRTFQYFDILMDIIGGIIGTLIANKILIKDRLK